MRKLADEAFGEKWDVVPGRVSVAVSGGRRPSYVSWSAVGVNVPETHGPQASDITGIVLPHGRVSMEQARESGSGLMMRNFEGVLAPEGRIDTIPSLRCSLGTLSY